LVAQNFTISLACGDNTPFRVRRIDFESTSLLQFSPFPCDNNRIELRFTSIAPLYGSCNPRVTLSGLTGTLTPSALFGSTIIPIVDAGTGQQLLSGSGSWDQSTGTMVINIGNASFLNGFNDSSRPLRGGPGLGAPFAMDFGYIFWLINPLAARSSASVKISLSISDGVGLAVSQKTGVISVATVHGVPDQAWASNSKIGIHPSGLAGSDSFISKVSDYTANDPWGPQDGDSLPLQVRSFSYLIKAIGQTSPFPCDENIIQVSIMFNTPLLLRDGICNPMLTIRGLTGSQTVASRLNLSPTNSSASIFASPAVWNWTAGEVVLSILNTTQVGSMQGAKPGVQYSFSFKIVNQAQPQPAPAVSIQSSLVPGIWPPMDRDGITVLPKFEVQAGDAQPLKIFSARLITKTRASRSLPRMLEYDDSYTTNKCRSYSK